MSDRPAGGRRGASRRAAAGARPPRRWPWVLLGSGLLLGGVVAYSPTLFGGLLLARLGGSGVQAGRVSGPLWAPRVEDARVQLPGVSATVGAAGVTVTGVDPATRTVRVAVAAQNADADLKLSELLGGGGGGGAAGGGWKVVLSGVDIRDSRLRVDGQGVNVPNLRAQVDQGEGGRLKVDGSTDDGKFTAGVTVAETAAGANRFTVDVDADARIARHYWNGIEAGRIQGRYVLGDGPVRGDLRVSGGVVQVPEARFVRVTGVTGRATHRGEQIGFRLAGQGWDGPVTARGGVDLEAQNWTVSADASPAVAGLARAVGTTGQGTLKLRVTAGGWSTVRVKGYAKGEGTLAGVPFEAAQAEYTFLSADSAAGDGQTVTGQTNDLAFSARTRLAGAQTLTGRWAIGRAGTAAWKGDFAGRALDLTAGINARNIVTLEGAALGGPLAAHYALGGGQLSATLNPDYGAARARVSLSGTAEDLRATVSGGQAGPFALSGRARYDRSGLRADLAQPGGGRVRLDLDRELRGDWAVQKLSGAGATLGGSGTLDLTGGDVRGDVQAQVPGLEQPLSGPLDLNFIERRGTFRSGEQALGWNGETFTLRARDLAVTGGAAVSGDLSVNTKLEAVGTLRAEGNGYDLRADASGTTARVRGTAGGVTVLADADLRAPYRTTARIEGTDIRGSLSVQGGVRFSLTTLGDTASGLVDGADWRATGRVNLAALRPLLPAVAGLGGTVDLNLAGLGGTARVRAQAAGATVTGTLTRRGDTGQTPVGTVTADLRAALPLGGDTAGATLTGRVYPDVQASGAASFMGQTLRATVSGPYGTLGARLNGRTGELSFGGVSVPAQDIAVTGTLTPALSASGRWGNLGVTYDGRSGLVRVAGAQTLTAFGQTGQVQGRATWGPGSRGTAGFRGAVEARGTLDQYTVALSGPWDRLNVLVTDGEGLRAEGRASLPAGRYDLNVRGPLTVPGAGGDGRLFVDGNIQGTGASPRGTLSVRDRAGGAATVTLRGFDNLRVDARRLTLGGQTLEGRLSAANGVLSGRLRAGPLDVVAAGGRISASGTVAGQTVRASGRLTLPATVSDLNLRVDGPYLSARATGGVSNLRGTVRLKAQRFGSGAAALVVPAQTLPLSGTLTGARVSLSGLSYAGGAWAGRLGLRYRLESAAGTQPGTLSVAGDGPRLSVLPSGPLGGRLQVLPSIGGTLSADLAPFVGLLPENLRAVVRPGQLVAEVRATGADVSLRQTRYAGAPLGLDAQLDWRGGVSTQGIVAQGVLTHPGTRLPVRLAGGTLSVSGGRLDARALSPLLADTGLPGVTGAATLDLRVPELDFARASGALGVDLRASGGEVQDVRGRLTLRGGQLAADLRGTVSGLSATVRGPLYPQADAALTVRAPGADGPRLSATLRGSAAESLALTATGAYAGRALTLNATGQGLSTGAARATVSATVSGATLDLGLTRGAGNGLGAWRVAGQLAAPDLGALAGTDGLDGALSATLGGTLADLRAQASGEAAGARFTVPARFTGGTLRLQGATATLTGTALAGSVVRASGPVYPTLALSARADVNKGVPGRFTAQVGGSFAKPDVNVQGRLTRDLSGLAVAGTRLSARLLGQDWKANFSGEAISGPLRGRLGTAAPGGLPGGLLSARLNLRTRYRSGGADVALTGAAGWNARAGWLGTLRAVGTVPGGALNATLNGSGALKLAGTLGSGARQASFSGALGAGLPLRPGGTLTLNRLDAGAFWGRPGQLGVGGTLRLGGSAWNRVEATFAGRTEDTLGELSGDVRASYRAGDVALSLAGPALSGAATLKGGRYDATLKTPSLRLARLLPASLDVDALTFAGTAEAHGTLAGGPESFSARTLALRGEQGQVGPFSLYGSAEYRPQGDVLKADLRGSLRGGLLSARGSLPQGLNLRVNGVPTAYTGAASFGTGKVDAALTLAGQVRDPTVSGTLNAVTDQLAARLTLSGRASDPHLLARAELRGEGQGGALYADVQGVDLAAGTARTSVYGSVQAAGNRADVKLAGQWPELSGTVQAKLGALADPLTLRGDGRGGYALDAGRLGGGDLTLTRAQGFIPTLAGRLDLTPLGLVAGGSGRARVAAVLGGTVAAPTLAATVTTTGAAVAGVSLADLSGTLTGSVRGLSGTLSQNGAEVASLSGQTLTLRDFALEAAGSRVRASGTANLNGVADLALSAAGSVSGNLKATYRAQALAVQGSVAAQGLNANLNVNADPYTGWHGTARVTGGPQGVLTAPADLALSGPFARPLLTGTAGLLGAGARLVADARGVQLRLVDGPGATASGAVELRPIPAGQSGAGQWRWLGATSLTRPELSLSVTPSGLLADPRLVLSLRRGEWRAAGTASRAAADLSVSDGAASGRVTWNGQQVTADLPGLDLARLDVGGLSGRVTANGSVDSRSRDGAFTFRVAGVSAPQELPYLGLPLTGDVSGDLRLEAGRPRVQATAALSAGTLNLTAAQSAAGPWTGTLAGQLRKDAGTLNVDLRAADTGLSGTLGVTTYPVQVSGQTLTVGGQVNLTGQTFTGNLRAGNAMGSAQLTAEGGLADLVPALERVLAVKPTGEGYSARAILNEVDLGELELLPGLGGKLSGEANLNDGGGTFFVQSAGLKLGPQTEPVRLEGTQVAGNWRLRGYLGRTQFTAGLGSGEVFGQATLQALPLGALVGAVTGTTPGEGVVTGIARFRVPLANPAAGSATVVAERIRVSARTAGETEPVSATATTRPAASPQPGTTVNAASGVRTETLVGSGTLDYAAGELRNVNIQLSGAGTWDVRGQYTRQKVDLSAQFSGTTFTPVLRLIPGLAELQPSLRGTLTLSAAGTYDRPRGLLRAQNLSGSVAGLSVQVPEFAGDLPDSGAFTGGGRVLTGGTVGTDGRVDLRGQLTLGKLSGTQLTFSGLVAPEVLGALPNTTVTLSQRSAGAGQPERWTVAGQSASTNPTTGAGTLALSGTLSPLDLNLAARNYNLPLAVIYGRESALTGDLRAVAEGQLIRVSGAADFARLTLGRVNATTTIPGPGESAAANTDGRTTDNFASPLPEQYTTFPQPQQEGGEEEQTTQRPFLERLILDDLRVTAPNGIRVDENLARAEFGTTGLTISGTGARPRIRGQILAQRGSLFLRENEFTITEGRVGFGGEGLYPTFTVTARGTVAGTVPNASGSGTRQQQVPIVLSVAGDFRTVAGRPGVLNLTTALSCAGNSGDACVNPSTNAAFSEPELYALVVTGVPDLASLPSNLGTLGASALRTALNVFVLGEIERTLARALGLDVFRLTPTLSTEGDVNATITVGSYLTRELFLQYQTDLSGNGLVDASYSTPDGRFTFRVSTPLTGLNLESIRPNFSADYNVSRRTSLSLGVTTTASTGSDPESTRVRFGVTYRFGVR
ncbi:translocation/assembly module TamB domain-containing protein [Deinococcus petrolearius]|uniref:Translocation/assembly module TamB domain-containing protein n=1 Tax=Deinococcus petrolearius TaxID=1751295 RepID=A0ABW1DFX4_9DEIO